MSTSETNLLPGNRFPGLPRGRALLFKGSGKGFAKIEANLNAQSPQSIIVKNLYTTLCGSDIHTYCGLRKEPDNVVLGHEIVGEIVWLGPESACYDVRGEKLVTGDRIVWSIFAAPPHADPPREDIPQKSDGLFKYGHAAAEGDDVFTGGLADYCVLKPYTAVAKVSEHIDLKVAAGISCAHATVAGALRVAGEVNSKRVLVFGGGLLGLSCLAMCKEAGAAHIVLADNNPSRLEMAKSFGADESFLIADNKENKSYVPEYDLVFDMTGYAEAMEAGLEALATGGCAVWIGAVFPAKPVQVNAETIVRKILTIRGLHNYNYEDFETAADFIEQNFEKYPFEKLVSAEFSLTDTEKAFSYAQKEKPVRVGINLIFKH